MGFRFRTVLALLTLFLTISPISGTITRAAARDHGDRGGAEINGTIQSLPAGPGFIGDWMVAGKTVHVTASTQIDEDDGTLPAVGGTVEVNGTAQADGSITATRIEVRQNPQAPAPGAQADFTGLISALPASGLVGDWTVAGKTVHVTAATAIDQEHGAAAVGATVEVRGTTQADGSVNATRIEVKQGVATTPPPGAGQAEFRGLVCALPTTGVVGDWMVGTTIVHVTAATSINLEHLTLAVGVMVEVHGTTRADGSIDATTIELQAAAGTPAPGTRADFTGTIEALPASGLIGDWTVSGKTVHVTAATMIKQKHGVAAVGATVEVDGTLAADGSVAATEIDVEDAHDQGEVEGLITSLPAGGLIGDWVIGTTTVHVTSATTIDQEHGQPVVGALAEAKGTTEADGSLDATRIEVRAAANKVQDADFRGLVSALPAAGLVGTWTVSGKTVNVTAATRIDQEHGAVVVGSLVEVEGFQMADGSIDANRIEVVAAPGAAQKIDLEGSIDSLPATGLVGDWTISGTVVHVTADTRLQLKTAPAVGLSVEVTGTLGTDGTITALKLKVTR